jgi:hypothetical protein
LCSTASAEEAFRNVSLCCIKLSHITRTWFGF